MVDCRNLPYRTEHNMHSMSLSRVASLAVAVIALACSVPVENTPTDPGSALHALFDAEWDERLRENPMLATSVGLRDYDDRLASIGLEDLERRDQAAEAWLAQLDALDRETLTVADRANYDIFRAQLQARRDDFAFGTHEIPFNADSGFHSAMARLPAQMPFDDTGCYERYLSRLQALPKLFAQQIDHMKRGLERGMTQPRVVLDGIEDTIAVHVVDEPESSLFWAPFETFPLGVPATEHERLRAAGRDVIRDTVVPAYRDLLTFMTGSYIPGARETIAAQDLPNGKAYYQQRVRHFTTIDTDAEAVHQIGLGEVARIRAEMESIVDEVGFEGTFAEFLHFLRTDPRFYPTTPEQLLKEAAWIAKRMDAKLPTLFGRLPRQPYGVEPVPESIAPKYTAGRYVSAPLGSTRGGTYWVNTFALESRPLYALEALSLHEAVPGHHLQGALNKELDLPAFRRYSYISAFGEGWGLYSERLGLEAGFYTDPYSNFGRLTYEMWRACRLVVDTGMHAFGWTRQQTLDYLANNTALSLHEVRTETDRYISWPGQALAYKMGEIEIRRLRAKAEAALGSGFDIRAFHDAVLENGSVPLPVLAERIDAFIASQG